MMDYMDYWLADDKNLIVGEGPLWDNRRGCLFTLDFRGKELRRIDHASEKTESMFLDFDPGCIALTEDGRIIAASRTDIRLVKPGESSELLCGDIDFRGLRFNDGKVGPDGRFYLGSKGEPGSAAFYCLDYDLRVHLLFDGVTVSNGLAWSSDGKHMFYCDSALKTVDVFDFDSASGSLSSRQTVFRLDGFADDVVLDGMTIDENDHLWIAVWNAGCLLLLDPQRGRFELFPMPVSKVTCPTFGGPDNDELYVTSAAYMTDLAKWPEAGNTFGYKFGVRGHAPFRFKMMK